MRCCCVIPVFNHASTAPSVIERACAVMPDVLVIDDGSEDIDLAEEDILNNERQIAFMKMCYDELKTAYDHLGYVTTDVIVTDLDAAYHDLCQILGKEYQEDLIDHMFRNFCLGK